MGRIIDGTHTAFAQLLFDPVFAVQHLANEI
jgi:hypothetical protein